MAEEPNILQPESNYDEDGKLKPAPGQPEGHNFPGEMIPHSNNRDCETEFSSGWGKPTTFYPYIWFGNMSEEEWERQNRLYPGACKPWRHATAQIDSLQINRSDGITGLGGINITGDIFATNATFTLNCSAATFSSTAKLFDIPHPSKENHRLRHACLEGPENGVYIRGRLTGKNVIELPDYWKDLVDPSTITVTLTQIRTSQDLIVDAIEWGQRVKIKSGSAAAIDCFYTVQATRKDVAPLEVEYEGTETVPVAL